jgi:Fuc2NAc and GlcNAc transferase
MSSTFQILLVVLAFLLSFVMAGFLTLVPNFLPDVPNQRSLHRQVVPRGGGLSFSLTFLVLLGVILILYPATRTETVVALYLGCVLITGLGLLDDAFALPALTRLTIEFAVALSVCAIGAPDRIDLFGIIELQGWAVILLQILWILTCINFFNFMDGVDGLATIQAWFIALVFGAAMWLDLSGMIASPDFSLAAVQPAAIYQFGAVLLFALAAALLGFLVWNLPPARIFMGDTGSHFLGFLLGFLAVVFPWAPENLPQDLTFRVSLFEPSPYLADQLLMTLLWAPFLLDPGLTLLRRLRRGQNLLRAHREHFYQLLFQRGWGAVQVISLHFTFNLLMLGPAALKLAGVANLYVLGAAGVLVTLYALAHHRLGASLMPPGAPD